MTKEDIYERAVFNAKAKYKGYSNKEIETKWKEYLLFKAELKRLKTKIKGGNKMTNKQKKKLARAKKIKKKNNIKRNSKITNDLKLRGFKDQVVKGE